MSLSKIVRPKCNYSVVSNLITRNKKISVFAKGVYFIVMSLPDDWDFSVRGIISITGEGKHKIYKALAELKKTGYCTTKQIRGASKIEGIEYTFHNEPQAGTDLHPDFLDADFLDTDFLDTDFLDTENRTQLNNQQSSINLNKLTKRVTRAREGKKLDEGFSGVAPEPPSKKEKKQRPPQVAAAPPTLAEAADCLAGLGNPNEADRFWNYYQARGWAGIADWRALAASWAARVSQYQPRQEKPTTGKFSASGRLQPDYTNAAPAKTEAELYPWRNSPEHLAAVERKKIEDEQRKNGTYIAPQPVW
jgi:hypothetical protein